MRTIYVIGTLALLSVASCSVKDWPVADAPSEQPVGQGGIDIQLKGSAPTRATTTTITKEEADLFLVTITKSDQLIAQQTLLGKVGSMTFPAGYGYKVFVENITDVDAETLNDGWGAKRFTGNSKSFGIQPGQTTAVAVSCSVANAAVAVNIADEVRGCTVTITDGTRILTTSENGKVAYFNVPPTTSVALTLTVKKNDVVVSEQDLSLEAAQVKDVNIKPSEENQQGTMGINITYDDTFEVVETIIDVE